MSNITSYQEFRSALVSSEERRQFLLDCATQGFRSIHRAWPDRSMRFFVFGSVANASKKVGIHSDLDIAISGHFSGICDNERRQSAILADKFRQGLSNENKLISIDLVRIDANNPRTTFAKDILENGIEIKMDN